MQACQVDEHGQPRYVLRLRDVERPNPGSGQALVRVRASPINFPDVLLCRGEYQVKPDLPFTPGVELCGDIVEFGPDAPDSSFSIGDRIIGGGGLPSGGFGEYALMDVARSLPAPEALSDAEASALFIGYQTGWFGLHRRAGLRSGETLLVHAAAGGVGSAAIQLGKAAGATVLGVVGGERKAEVARQLGADIVIDRHRDDFVGVVKETTGGRGADVVYDPVGGDTYTRSTKCIAFEGRILIIGFAGGTIPTPGLNHALIKNYSIVGLHWGLYSQRDPQSVVDAHAELSRLAADGAVKPLISEELALADVADGVQRVGDGDSVGRVVYRG